MHLRHRTFIAPVIVDAVVLPVPVPMPVIPGPVLVGTASRSVLPTVDGSTSYLDGQSRTQ